MKKLFFFSTLIFSFQAASYSQNGETHYKTVCAACHTIGKGMLVGPDLKGVSEKYQEDWLIKWIKSSQSLVKAGDETAASLFKKYNQIPMPDNPNLTDENVKEILSYIKTKGDEKKEEATAVPPAPSQDSSSSGNVAATNTGINISTSIYILFGVVVGFLLLVIITLSKSVSTLSKELEQGYRHDSYNKF